MQTEHFNQLSQHLQALSQRAQLLKQTVDFSSKWERLQEVVLLMEDPSLWKDPARAQDLGRERKTLEAVVLRLNDIEQALRDHHALLELAQGENEQAVFSDIAVALKTMEGQLLELEFRRMFLNPMDPNACFMDIQPGAGGTEAQDWAGMLLRMYLRYGERKGFKTEILEESTGEVAGIASATVKFSGKYAYGFLRTETGVHRLVRASPFDSNNRRHTSFCSVFVYPEIDDTIEIEINPADLRVDTYRASGAGGQHINKTDSAVRITHGPSGIVVQCQNDRSQHRNRDEAMQLLRARLYELELRKRQAAQQQREAEKADIGWGSQIRSYVFDQSRIKDLRTDYETGHIKSVMDGDLDAFIEMSLKKGL